MRRCSPPAPARSTPPAPWSHPATTAAQADRAVDNLLAVLARHGAGPEHLVRTTVYVVGTRADLVAAWDVVAGRLAPHRPPSTLLGVAVLGYPGQLVEVDGIAALPAPGAGPGLGGPPG